MYNYVNPYMTPAQPTQVQPQPQPPQSSILWVQGEAGAKSFLVAPGASVLLMDSESSRFYIKSADQSGIPCPLRTFEYSEISPKISAQADERSNAAQFVTRKEFSDRMEEIMAILRKESKDEPSV